MSRVRSCQKAGKVTWRKRSLLPNCLSSTDEIKFCGWVGDSHHLHLRPFERNTTIFLEHCKFLASFSFTIQQNLCLNKCSNTKWTPNVPAYRRAHSDGNDTHSCETENYVIQTTFLTVSISSPKYSLFSMCVCLYVHIKKPLVGPVPAAELSKWVYERVGGHCIPGGNLAVKGERTNFMEFTSPVGISWC